MIDECVNTIRRYDDFEPIYYLTIHESLVPAGISQRRPGLHTDAHSNEGVGADITKGKGYWHRWGAGEDGAEHVPRRGGIFMASTVAGSTAGDCCLLHIFIGVNPK